jgi:protein TonB
MASSAKIEQALPDTLPEDFGGWDSEDSPATLPVNSGGFQAAPGFVAVPKPPAQPAKPQATVARSVAAPIRSDSAVADGMHNAASLKAAAAREADEELIQTIRSNSASMEKQKRTGKKWMMVSAVAAGLILILLALIPLFKSGRLPMFRQPVEVQPAATETQSEAITLKPSQPAQLTSDNKPASAVTQQTKATQPATAKKEVILPQVQSKMMEDQLTTPTRIPQNLKIKAVEEEPPSLGIGAAGMEGQGGNGAIGSVFGGQSQSKVNVAPPKTVTVSAGVAGGLLVQRTAPVYPPIAKTARVTGTVVLKATISKTGIIENLRVVSGPPMLTQAAVDAVRTWRYKPYKLNNDPVEIETTVNVIFTLGG